MSDQDGLGNIDTYFERLEEDKAFAEELKKYMESGDEGESEDAPSGASTMPDSASPAGTTPSEPAAPPPPPPLPSGAAKAEVAGLLQKLEALQEKRTEALRKLRDNRRVLRESSRLQKFTEAKLRAAERVTVELRSSRDKKLARVEDLSDGLERLRRAYDVHLKITEGLKAVCDKLLDAQRKEAAEG